MILYLLPFSLPLSQNDAPGSAIARIMSVGGTGRGFFFFFFNWRASEERERDFRGYHSQRTGGTQGA